jgi:serine/threonine-protein kinase RsbW
VGLDEEASYHFELCAVEAVTNSIRHAYHNQPGQPVRTQIVVETERIELRVADRGSPIPEERRASPHLVVDPANLDSIQEGGRGIFLMHELMDEVSFLLEDGWNIVVLAKRRPG